MRSTVVLSVIGVVAIVSGTHDLHRQPQQRFMAGECKALQQNFIADLRKTVCKPRETLVTLESNDSTVQIIPRKAAVMLCDGGTCLGGGSCLPKKKEVIAISVKRRSVSTGIETCGYIYLEQHTRCGCGCTVMRHHCTARQYYDARMCSCRCMNAEEARACVHQDREWDPNNCSCKCKDEISCSTGTEWVPSMCKCMRVMDEYGEFLSTH